jgi:carbonic anhydrase
MRLLIALIVCIFTVATANADEPAPAAHATVKSAPEAAKPKPAEHEVAPPKSPSPSKVIDLPAPPPKSARAKEEAAEVDLSAKITERIAAMHAQQAARAARAAKVRKIAASAVVATPALPPVLRSTHWSYEGETGPLNWGKINPEWAKCAAGERQSPIDIHDGIKVDLEQIGFDYKPSAFNVIDNGHTVQVTVGTGNYITVQNRAYELVQFHFHRPSEERINGKGFEMVVHMVHKDSEGHLAVVAVLLERGKPNNVIQTVWNNLPLEKQETVVPSIVLDVNEILPERREYFTYMGSLTTPPCSEGVLWMVMKQPMPASAAQMALFSRLYPLNSRPIQKSSGRVIKESN